MAEVNSTQKRESDESNDSCDDSNEESYENYSKENSEGYNAYKEAGQIEEAVYDRYESDYESDETPDQEAQISSCYRCFKKSCFKIGRLSTSPNRESKTNGVIFQAFQRFFIDEK